MPRKLKVLAIHDGIIPDTGILGNFGNFIDLWKHRIEGEIITRISSYTQVLSLLQNKDTLYIETPDIILVDFLFGDDRAANFTIGTDIDPRGILYGSLLIPFFSALKPYLPLGYEIYSLGINAAENDNYAKTFLLLLKAIFSEMESEPVLLNESTLEESVKKFINCHIGMKEPKDALEPAIWNYRENIKTMVKNGKIFPDLKLLDFCHESVLSSNKNLINIKNIEDLYFKWTHPRGSDKVFLSSLFFDCFFKPENDVEKKHDEVIKFLKDINEIFIEVNKCLYNGAKTAYECFGGNEIYSKDIWDAEYRNEQIVLCLLIAWAVNIYKHKNENKQKYKGNAFFTIVPPDNSEAKATNKGVDRALKLVLQDDNITITRFIKKLNTEKAWMFNSLKMLRLKTLTIRYLRESNEYNNEKYWPDCLNN